MKKLLLSSVAILAIATSPVFAADLPAPMAEVEAMPAVAAPIWSGVYIGAQVGYAFDDGSGDDCPFEDAACDEFSDTGGDFFVDSEDDGDGIFGGLHIGADMQRGSFVFGALLDANWRDGGGGDFDALYDPDIEEALSTELADGDLPGGNLFETAGIPGTAAVDLGTRDDFLEDIDPLYDIEGSNSLDWFGTARLRAGVAPGGGRFLIYGTGGLAFGHGDNDTSGSLFYSDDEADFVFGDTDGNAADGFTAGDPLPVECGTFADSSGGSGVTCAVDGDESEFVWGWALGAGIEVLATDNFSVGLEYLYVNLDQDFDDFDIDGFDGIDNESAFHTVSLRGSWRFGGGQ